MRSHVRTTAWPRPLCAAASVDCEYPDKPQETNETTTSGVLNTRRTRSDWTPSPTDRQRPREVRIDSSNEALARRIEELESLIRTQQQRQPQQSRAASSQGQLDFSDDEEEASVVPLQPSKGTSEQFGTQPIAPFHESVSPLTNIASSSASTLPQGNAIGQFEFVNNLPFPEAAMPSFSPNTLSQLLPVVYPLPYHGDFPIQSTGEAPPSGDEEASIIIPAGHHTTTSSLFTLPSIRRLVGDYSPSLFYEIESSRAWDPPLYPGQEVFEVLDTLDLSIETTGLLIANFFT